MNPPQDQAIDPHSDQFGDITVLALEHPGAHDPTYRARRDEIARLARIFSTNQSDIPTVTYTSEEDATWKAVVEKLKPLHAKNVSGMHLAAQQKLAIPEAHVPQLKELSRKTEHAHGFRLAPTEGLIDPRSFLSALGHRTMFCTQYIRHASKPEYTPEPDIVHEVIGHVPAFMDRDMVDFSVQLGKIAKRANDAELAEIERLYWYTIEFGLIEEQQKVKAFGAGLLSSIGELEHCMSSEVTRKPFDLKEIIATPYDFSMMQNTLFIMPSFSYAREKAMEYFKHLL